MPDPLVSIVNSAYNRPEMQRSALVSQTYDCFASFTRHHGWQKRLSTLSKVHSFAPREHEFPWGVSATVARLVFGNRK
jgi:hypothetical protein